MVVSLTPDQAPRWVAEQLAGRAARTRWIGIDGFGAAGKTTLAYAVAAAVPGAVVVSIDDFARPDLVTWDQDRFVAQVLEPLLAGRAARYQRWDWPTDAGAEWHLVPPGIPVIVEGVSATDVRLGVPWDLTLWVDVPAEVRWARVRQRDPADSLDLWQNVWLPSEQAYAAAQRPWLRVDALVVA